MLNKRICIYPKDIQLITGRTERYGRKLLKKIRQHYSKEEHQIITITEFCTYIGVAKEEIEQFITD